MTELESLVVRLSADASGYDSVIKGAAGGLDDFSKKTKDIGGDLTKNVTLPIVGVAVAATAMATDMNAQMANVAALGLVPERVLELKSNMQEMAVSVGKSTEDLTGGLYMVVSAFGDTADTVGILEINAKAAAAGLATTTDAINLTSAVTKGYGDTSEAAVQHVADLALQTVKMGQTTFPELAASMGKVTPIAAALGVTQEELFAQMATLTGVTGGAAEVSTQLRAVYQSILKPTTDMGDAMAQVARSLENEGRLAGGPLVDAWRAASDAHMKAAGPVIGMVQQLQALDTTTKEGADAAKVLEAALKDQRKAANDSYEAMIQSAAALGPAIVESVGMAEATNMLSETANGNTDTMGKMFGSVEALTAVLALSGGQADAFQEKMTAMNAVTGETDKAFAAQTEGINKGGFAMAQAAVQGQVLMQKLGDGLAPALSKLMDIISPWVDKLIEAVDWFANADSGTQTWIVTIAALVAAIGPVLMVVGTLGTAISGVVGFVGAASAALPLLGTALAVLTGPIGLIVAAVAALALAWKTDFLGIKTKTKEFGKWLTDSWPGWMGKIKEGWKGFTDWWKSDSATKIESVKGGWQKFTGWLGENLGPGLADVKSRWSTFTTWLDDHTGNHWKDIEAVAKIGMDAQKGVVAAGLQGMQGDWSGGLETLRSAGETAWASVYAMFSTQIEGIKAFFTGIDWAQIGTNILEGIRSGIVGAALALYATVKDIADRVMSTIKWALGIDSPSTVAATQVGIPVAQGIGVGLTKGMRGVGAQLQGAVDSLMGDVNLSPSLQVAGAGGTGGMTVNVYMSGNGTYESGRAVGRGVLDELRGMGVR